jgi:hypothetical protein
VGVIIVGGVGDLALKGARAGPCDDEDKMCCQRERMRKEIKMSPLKFTKSVVFNGSHCIFTTYSVSAVGGGLDDSVRVIKKDIPTCKKPGKRTSKNCRDWEKYLW